MLNPISILRSIFRRQRVAPPPRTSVQVGSTPTSPPAGQQEAVALSPEKFREMFTAMLADPETRGAIMRGLAAYFPVAGAAGCSSITSNGGTANYLPKFTAACNIENSNVYQSGSNIGIGTTSPTVALEISGTNAGLKLDGAGTH